MSKYRMKCTVTGLEYATNAVGRAKLIKRYGSEAALETDYVSRLGRRLLKEGLTVDEIRAKVDAGEITASTAPAKSTKSGKAKKSKAAKAPKVSETVESLIADDSDIDPDVAAFLQADESEQPESDASDRAI